MGLQPISERLFAGQLSLGVQRSLLNPVATVAQVTGEYFMGIHGQGIGMIGLRAGVESPLLHVGGGWQYEFRREEYRPYVTIRHPLRRGGVFWPGGEARVRWVMGKDPSVVLGVTAPLARPFAGKTRPPEVKARVPLPFAIQESRTLPQSAATREAFAVASSAAQRIARLYVPYLGPATENALSDKGKVANAVRLIGNELGRAPGAATTNVATNLPVATVREYHRALENVFVDQATQSGLSASDYATAARRAILDEVLLPYNRFLGRKKGSDTFKQLAARARIAFLRDLVLQRGMDRARIEPAESVFSQLLDIVQAVEKRQRTIWDDDRLSFLPLQLALLPEEHDTQAEIDALLGRAIETPFTGGNRSWYVVGEQFEWELIRMIHDTRKYHVLWIHDFRGQDDGGDPDAVSFQTVVKGYLDALANRIEAYDREGGLPVYMIFIDQWFYEVNNGRYWLELLEDPMRHKLKLPREFKAWATEIREAQERLRRAVANSRMLQAEAREYGEEWLYNRVRVQVNVTNPADATFFSRELMPWVGLPDAMIRDHRKIAFFDVDPNDETRGRALYTGMGVGEHYNGATWDDRAMMVEGPALRSLRRAAHDLLLQQGLTEQQIPFPLQDTEGQKPAIAAAAADASAVTPSGMMLDAHNKVGYGDKRASVLKATMYNLMPPGTVAKTPDSLWNFPLWGSLLTGLALRGGKVTIIAPSYDNAPAQAFGSIALARNVLGQMVRASHDLEAPIGAAGGLLKVGMYKPKVSVGDVPGRTRQVAATLRANRWFRELDGFAEDEKGLDLLADSLEQEGFKARYLESEGVDYPKLHMKAQLFVTAEGWNPLRVPESQAFLLAYLRQRAVQLSTPGHERDLRLQQEALAPASRAVAMAVMRGTTPADRERAAYYLLVGSHNQNFRSAILDGEVLVAVSGQEALVALADFTEIEGLSEWIDTPQQLEPHFPSTNAFLRVIANWGRIVF